MSDHPLSESGPLALGAPVTLTHADGSTTETRGSLVDLPHGAAHLSAPATALLWTPSPPNRSRVIAADVGGRHYQVLDVEPTSGALYSAVAWQTSRYRLRET